MKTLLVITFFFISACAHKHTPVHWSQIPKKISKSKHLNIKNSFSFTYKENSYSFFQTSISTNNYICPYTIGYENGSRKFAIPRTNKFNEIYESQKTIDKKKQMTINFSKKISFRKNSVQAKYWI